MSELAEQLDEVWRRSSELRIELGSLIALADEADASQTAAAAHGWYVMVDDLASQISNQRLALGR